MAQTDPDAGLKTQIAGGYYATTVGIFLATWFSILPSTLFDTKIDMLSPLFTRFSRNDDADSDKVLISESKDVYIPNATRRRLVGDGSLMQLNYLAAKVKQFNADPIWTGVSHGLRQNVFTQTLFSNNFIVLATVLDVPFGVINETLKLAGAPICKGRWPLRNLAKTVFMNLGMIAPSGTNLFQIIENSPWQPASGRFAYEKHRLTPLRNRIEQHIQQG